MLPKGAAAVPAPAGAVIAAIAYKRPKVAGFLVGAVTLATAPYLGFMIASMNRWVMVSMLRLLWLLRGRAAVGHSAHDTVQNFS